MKVLRSRIFKIGLAGMAYRGHSNPTLRDRADFILARCNNSDISSQSRLSDRVKGYFSTEPWDVDVHAITTVPLRKGNVIDNNSNHWLSADFGINRLDMQLTFSGLDLKNERLSRPTLIEVFKARLLGRGGPLSDLVDISFLDGAEEIAPPQRELRNKDIINAYTAHYFLPEIDLPKVNEQRLFDVFLKGGFSESAEKEIYTPLYRFTVAMSALSNFEKAILGSRYGIGGKSIETQEAVGSRYNFSGSEIGKYERRMFDFFQKLNSERNDNIANDRCADVLDK